jgi:hypothetical protein
VWLHWDPKLLLLLCTAAPVLACMTGSAMSRASPNLPCSRLG